ncbi:MAG: hypothetical protein LPD71_00150 [Shewanella sp.]|nr:hypothetical protein [Shewanella sp.]MCF1459473.1 hypothetical protein [Shewanella sp.]
MSNLSDFIQTGSGGGDGKFYTVSWSAPIAAGGETVLAPPYAFVHAMVFINGNMQDETRGAFRIESNRVLLSMPMEAGDEAQVIMGQVIPPGSSDWNLLTTDADLETGHYYMVNTEAGHITLTLPAAPKPGEMIELLDIGGAMNTHHLTLARNFKKIMGNDEDLNIYTNHIAIRLLYSDASHGWRILD